MKISKHVGRCSRCVKNHANTLSVWYMLLTTCAGPSSEQRRSSTSVIMPLAGDCFPLSFLVEITKEFKGDR